MDEKAPPYTPVEAAKKLNISRRQVLKMIDAGTLPAVRISQRIIRIHRKDVEQLLEGQDKCS